MAITIPEKLINKRISIKQIVSNLKNSLNNDFVIRIPFQVQQKRWTPDLAIENSSEEWLFICVSDVKEKELKSYGLLEAFILKIKAPLSVETLINDITKFAESFNSTYKTSKEKQVVPKVLIIFSNLDDASVKKIADKYTNNGYGFISKTEFRRASENSVKNNLTKINSDARDYILRTFFSEIEIDKSVTTIKPVIRDNAARLTKSFFLDFHQESITKTDLYIPEKHKEISKDFSIRLVNGVAGSGKTLILLYRAKMLTDFFPHSKILILIHNRPVTQELRYKFNHICKNRSNNVEIKTFFSWCYKHLGNMNILPEWEYKKLIKMVHERHFKKSMITPDRLDDEFNFIKDHMIFNSKQYMKADRTGRGFALKKTEREKVFDAMTLFDMYVKKAGKLTWLDVPRILLEKYKEEKVTIAQYDHILIDEAQFFAAIWFELVKIALKKKNGQLFLAADPNQGFLKRKLTWSKAGLNVRGRTQRLRKSYRTTRENLESANQIKNLLIEEKEKEEEYLLPDYENMRPGKQPVLIKVDSAQDEVVRAVNEIKQLLDAGCKLYYFLVLYTPGINKKKLKNQLINLIGTDSVWDMNNWQQKLNPDKKYFRMASLDSATGLEAEIVFILGTGYVFEKEQSLNLCAYEKENEREVNARRIYMAMTRASERVVMITSLPVPEELEQCVSFPEIFVS